MPDVKKGGEVDKMLSREAGIEPRQVQYIRKRLDATQQARQQQQAEDGRKKAILGARPAPAAESPGTPQIGGATGVDTSRSGATTGTMNATRRAQLTPPPTTDAQKQQQIARRVQNKKAAGEAATGMAAPVAGAGPAGTVAPPPAPILTPAQTIAQTTGIDEAKANQLAAAFEINEQQWLNNPKANILGFMKELARTMGLQADQVEQAAIAWKQRPKA